MGWKQDGGERWLPPEVVADFRPRRSRITPMDLAEFARIYLRHCATSTRTRQDAAADIGVADLTLRDYLSRAVELGLFTRRGRGRKGGELTPKAVLLLDGKEF